MNPMRKITNDHINALKAHQEVSRIMEEDTSQKRHRMKELDYNNLIAHQQVARMKIVDVKEKQKNLEKKDRCTQKSYRK